jgi:hypothetical protein
MTRYYSLYERQGKRWVRLTEMGLPKRMARMVFEDALESQTWTRRGENLTTGKLSLRPTGVTL